MKLYPILFVLLVGTLNAQIKKAAELYNQGVIKYNEQKYEEADSLFSQSLKKAEDKDAYFSRGLCRGKMANQRGYCYDMALASIFGHEKAASLFTKGCGKIDTVLEKFMGDAPHNILSKVVVFHARDTNFRFTQKYFGQEVSAGYEELLRNNSQDTAGVLTPSEFPGGFQAMNKFIQANLRFPPNVAKQTGKVFLRFIVFEDGTLHDIAVLKNELNHYGYAEEASRVIAMMPPWKPSLKGKHIVKCNFIMPLKFSTQ